MNYQKIYRADAANGIGFRVSLFVSGCKRQCKGCFNQEAWDPKSGKVFDEKAKQKLFAELEHSWCRGLSILGGEPMSVLSDNRQQVIALAKEAKAKFPAKDIWLWTSYTLEELQADNSTKEVLQLVDVLVDGPFVLEKHDASLTFRGSSNQRVIDMQHWRKTREVKELQFS